MSKKQTSIVALVFIFLTKLIYALNLPNMVQDIINDGIILSKFVLWILAILNFITSFQIQPFQLNAPFPDTLIHIMPFNSY
ncbi:MAG: hypothetical protein WCE94_14730, partial [Candidatus Methanoperedens sp.]